MGWLKGEGEADTGCNLNIRAFALNTFTYECKIKRRQKVLKNLHSLSVTSHLDHVPKL